MLRSAPAVAGSNVALVISTQQSAQAEVATAVLSEACSRLGISVEYKFVPHRRAARLAVSGAVDGELMRVAEYAEMHPDLIRVPVPVCFTRSYAFAEREYPIRSWEDLRGYRVGILRGVLLSERNTAGMSPYLGESAEKMFYLLDIGRLQVVVLSDLSGTVAARKEGLEKFIRPVGEPLAEEPLYVYLHKGRADLVSRLAEVLRGMEADGTGPALRRKVRADIMGRAGSANVQPAQN